MTSSRVLKIVAWTLAFAGAWSGARAEGVAVTLHEAPGGTYEVAGSFFVSEPATAVWRVLADYGRIGDFVPGVASSRVADRLDGKVIVEQAVRGEILWFSRLMTLRLEVFEDSPREIQFEDVGKKDFTVYRGRWTIKPSANGTQVTYALQANPRFAAPHFLVRKAFRKSATSLLDGVKEEIQRAAVSAIEEVSR